MKKLVSLLGLMLACSGCLLTRNEVGDLEQKKQMQEQVQNMQKSSAEQQTLYQDVLDQTRQQNGRLENLELQLKQEVAARESLKKANEQTLAEMTQKLSLLQEEVSSLRQTLENQRTKSSMGDDDSKSSHSALYAEAQKAYGEKDWKRAAVLFQKWREKNPRNKLYGEATYHLGVAFVEMGMKEEAQSFFDDVVKKFPGTPAAKKASLALKKIR